jgi:uncharacterized protein (DUF3084 family)
MFTLSNYVQESIDKQIEWLSKDISAKMEQVNYMEKRADELDERAEKLRKLSEMKEEYGFLWVVFSIAAGIVLAPFTGINNI